MGSRDVHLHRGRSPPGCQAKIWHFLVGKDGLVPCHHQIILQVTTHDGTGCCACAHEHWPGETNPAAQLSLGSSLSRLTSCALPASAKCGFSCTCTASCLQSFIWGDEKRQGEKSFYDYENKLETKMIQTKRQITLQSLTLTMLKPSASLKSTNPGFSEHLRLTVGFYAFLKPLI